MPVRNIITICISLLVCVASYHVAVHNRYASIFSAAMEIVENEALVKVPKRELFNAAMDGMLARLDANSWYISEDKYHSFEDSLNQQFVGVGMYFEKDEQAGGIRVVAPIPGKPAWRAGIRPGDLIVEIDGLPTSELNTEETIERIRGPLGSVVEFALRRDPKTSLLIVKVVREEIPVSSVVGDVQNDDGTWNFFLEEYPRIGYIRLLEFGRKSTEEMRAALRAIDGRVDGLILDLRYNPGGLLDAAVSISDMFIGREAVVVQIRNRDEQVVDQHFAKSKTDLDPGTPVVVLVNEYTASAAEILAACLQDHHRALVAGSQTYGKGTVQDLIVLEANRSVLRLTTSSYWRPSGRNIDKTVLRLPPSGDYGVRPDNGFEIPLTAEEQAEIRRLRLLRDDATRSKPEADENGDASQWLPADQPLRRALDWLLQAAGNKAA